MDFLYFLVKGSAAYSTDHDPIGLVKNYFEDGGAFNSSFIIALCTAIAGIIIFYGIFGMKIYKLARPLVYWIMFAIVGVTTFTLTQLLIIGSRTAQTGFFASAAQKFEEYAVQFADMPDMQNVAVAQRDTIETEMSGFCSAVVNLDMSNAVIALLIFFLLSLLVKGITVHAKRVPF